VNGLIPWDADSKRGAKPLFRLSFEGEGDKGDEVD